jgi:chromosome segregation ATPase
VISQLQGEIDGRLKELSELYERTNGLQNERNLLEAQLANLQRNFDAVEKDRLARGEAIEGQGQVISQLQGEIDGRLKELSELYERTNGLQNERNLLEAQLADLQHNFDGMELDRAARLVVIENQGQQLGRIPELEAENSQLANQLQNYKTDNTNLTHLVAQLQICEADRAALYANKWVKMGLKTKLIPTKKP